MQLSRYIFILLLLTLTAISCGGPNEPQAYDLYLKGTAKLNLHNYPEAIEAFLHAEKRAEETGNDSVLALSRVGMMNLCDSICDINEKALYAVKACEVYEKYHDYEQIYAILSEFTKCHAPEQKPFIHADKIRHYAKILNDNDTTRGYFYADTLERRGEWLYNRLDHIGSADITSWIFIEELNSFNPYNLSEKIKNDDGWREEISGDSANISANHAHLVARLLWDQGHDDKANDFINYYMQKYSEPVINRKIDTADRRMVSYVSFRYNDRSKEEFRSTFQEDVRAAAMQFNYEEIQLREQTIRSQHIIMACVIALLIVTGIAIGIYIRMSRLRQLQRQEQDMMSAAEMRKAFHDLEEQHLDTLDHLCNTYYENYSDRSAKTATARRALKTISEMAASESFTIRLEQHLNDTRHSLMALLRRELPELKRHDLQLFVYNAAGLSIPSVCLLLGEKREVIYNRRVRLRTRIQESDAPHRELFLESLR